MEELLARLWLDPVVSKAIIGIFGIGLLEWALGILAALRDGTFAWKYIDVWVRQQLLGRILVIVLVLLVGEAIGDITIGTFDINVMTATGLGSAAAYAAKTLQSIFDSLGNVANPDKTENPLPTDE